MVEARGFLNDKQKRNGFELLVLQQYPKLYSLSFGENHKMSIVLLVIHDEYMYYVSPIYSNMNTYEVSKLMQLDFFYTYKLSCQE